MSIFKKIVDNIVGEETEEQRISREEKYRLIENQKNTIANMKCPVCENKKFREGYISSNGSYGGIVSEIATYNSGFNEGYKDKVLVCSNCGYVLIFADFETKKIIHLK